MKNKGLIVAFSCACIFVVALVATIIVLASGTQNVGSSVSLIYVASDIAGSVSGTYQVGNNPAKDMTTSSGAKVVSFSADTPESLSLLSPNETINMLYGEDVILTYTFISAGEEYYAHMSYSDTDTPYTNLVFNYKKESDSSYATNTSKLVTVPRLGSTTFSVKISIDKAYLNASLNGTIDWALTKEKPIIVEEQVNLNIANNAGSKIDNNTFSYQTRTVDGKKQFKIVGATPVIDSTSTNGYVNGYYDRANLASTGKVSSIDDLTNSNGAEFFYFCTNPAVVGSTDYNDPGEIYYTSTSDTDLESWYDIPTSETQLYACFMVPNYTTEELYTGTDTQIIISNKVTNIIYKAFYNKSSITDVVIPQSVKNIGYGTSNTNYGAFGSCSNLTKVFIPNSVTSIGSSAFSACRGLTSVTIGSGVTSIGEWAFSDCSSLTNITIPDSVTSISSSAFYGCSGLTKITIPNSVTSIGRYAFKGCSGLTSITIPDSVTSIGYYAFSNCSGLTSITIPNSVTSIGSFAFERCTILRSITIPDSLTSIGQGVFSYCNGLTIITVSANNPAYYSSNNCIIKKSDNSLIKGCYTFVSVIPNGVTSIGDYAFSGCTVLRSVTIPDSVTSIGDSAFRGCDALTSIKIPDSVTSIGDAAFAVCMDLTSITIGNSVTSIGERAFYYCNSLRGITIPGSVTSIAEEAFFLLSLFDKCNFCGHE